MNQTSNSRRRVVVTGIGAVTPVGNTAVETFEALKSGRSGIGKISRYDTNGSPVLIAGEVKGFDPAAALPKPLYPRGAAGEPVTHILPGKEVKKHGRFTHLGLGAALEAYADSGLDAHRAAIAPERIGVNLGVGMGGLPETLHTHDTFKAGGYRKISTFYIIQTAPNILAGQLAITLDLRGPNMSVASACATSGHALGESMKAVQRGDADIMFAGGSEAVICPLSIGAFAQMRALSTRNDDPEKASRPYDSDRDGFVLSEGSVVFVLEELEHAKKRGARIYAELCGYGATADAHHISMLAPEAEGSRRSMRQALADAGISASSVAYVSAHATSTPGGDGEEASAIAAVFADVKSTLHVSGVKSMTGHLLGAAGAMGAFTAVHSIASGVITPTINLENIDPNCAALGLNFTPKVAVEKKVDYALANSFGFGGTNASLVFGRV